jgi:E3 ubiquitin-protein ligase HUWE1
MFDENELELLFNGLPSIDLAEFKAAVQYNSWRAGDEVVRWFWAAVESFSEEERARLLQFITGSSQLPLGGFGALASPISINKVSCAVVRVRVLWWGCVRGGVSF